MDKEVVLTVIGKEIKFNCTAADFDRFTNEVEPKNKTAGMHNFLMRTVEPADKETLIDVLKRPGATALIFGEVMSEATNDLQISVKK